jgi:hypothetical protein
MTPYSLVHGYQRFRGSYHLHLQQWVKLTYIIPPKCWQSPTRLKGFTSQKTRIDMLKDESMSILILQRGLYFTNCTFGLKCIRRLYLQNNWQHKHSCDTPNCHISSQICDYTHRNARLKNNVLFLHLKYTPYLLDQLHEK